MIRFRSISIALVVAALSVCAHAQGTTGGLLYASDFANWSLPQGNTPMQGTIFYPNPNICQVTSNGYTFLAAKVGRPLTIVDGINTETFTPSAVVVNNNTCMISGTMARSHSSYSLKSGTGGAQEAIDYQASLGQGSQVVLTPAWTGTGGTTGILNALKGNNGVTILDQRTAQFLPYTWNGSAFIAQPFSGGSVALGSSYQVPCYPLNPTAALGPCNLTADATGNNLNVPGSVTAASTNLTGLVTLNASLYSGADVAQKVIAAATVCANNCTIDVPQGTYTLAANATSPAGITLKLEPGTVVTVPSGVTWTLNSRIDAGRWQIFAGAGSVSFTSNQTIKEIYPEWWGAYPDGGTCTTDAAQGITQAALAAQRVNGAGGLIMLAQGKYSLFNSITSYALLGGSSTSPSFDGPVANRSGSGSGASLTWCGPQGGDMLHMIGGHYNGIRHINFNGAGSITPSRAMWIDSNNGRATTSSTVSSLVRSGCVTAIGQASSVGCIVTMTTSAAETTWASGTEVLFSGTSDTQLNNNMLPIWYAIDSTHFVFSSYGVNGTVTTPGTATVGNTGDVSQFSLTDDGIYLGSPNILNISSCSITANVMSCTLATPALLYPGRWIWITGSSDPVYNGYQQVLNVTGSTTFTATQTYNASEAATSSGQVYAPESGVAFGTNDPTIWNNSVCCTVVTLVNISAIPGLTTSPISGFEQDASLVGNTYNFSFKNSSPSDVRIGWLGFSKGAFKAEGGSLSSVQDSVIASPLVFGTMELANMEYENATPYIVSSMTLGSSLPSTAGLNGQFETGGNQGFCFIHDNNISSSGFGGALSPNNVAMYLNCNARVEGNRFDPVTPVSAANNSVVGATYTAGSGQTPGVYTVTGTGGGCGREPVLTVTVGADGAVDVAGSNTNPVLIGFAGFYCTSTPSFTLAAGGTPATLTPVMGALPWIMPTGSNGAAQIVSSGNMYFNVPFGGFGPFLNTAHQPFFGPGKPNTNGIPIDTKNDVSLIRTGFGVLPSATGTKSLAESEGVTKILYTSPTGTVIDADSGVLRTPNALPAVCSRNAANTGDDCLEFDASDNILYVQNNVALSIPYEDANGNLTLPGSIAGTYGGFSQYNNLGKDSALQTAIGGGTWSQINDSGCSSPNPLTLTANATADPYGGNTAATIAVNNPMGTTCTYQGISQTISPTLTNGATYTLSFWLAGGTGTDQYQVAIGNSVGGCTSGVKTVPSTSLTTSASRISFSCSAATYSASVFSIRFYTAGETYKVFGAQLTPGPSAGTYVTTTTAPVSGTGCVSSGAPCLSTSSAVALANGSTATTQAANDSSTKVATTAYADRAALGGVSYYRMTTAHAFTATGSNSPAIVYSIGIPIANLTANTSIRLDVAGHSATGSTSCQFATNIGSSSSTAVSSGQAWLTSTGALATGGNFMGSGIGQNQGAPTSTTSILLARTQGTNSTGGTSGSNVANTINETSTACGSTSQICVNEQVTDAVNGEVCTLDQMLVTVIW